MRITFDKLTGVETFEGLVGMPLLAPGPDPQLAALMIHWQS